jgi:hypothetical protein
VSYQGRCPTLDSVVTNSQKKRRSFGPGTTEQCKENIQEAEKRVVIQDTIDYDTPLDFLPLGFDVDEDDVDLPFVDTDPEEDEANEPLPTSPPNLPSGTPCFDRIYVHFHTSQTYPKS